VLHIAQSGDQALQLLDEEIKPELLAVLSDINMQGWTGSICLARSSSGSPVSR